MVDVRNIYFLVGRKRLFWTGNGAYIFAPCEWMKMTCNVTALWRYIFQRLTNTYFVAQTAPLLHSWFTFKSLLITVFVLKGELKQQQKYLKFNVFYFSVPLHVCYKFQKMSKWHQINLYGPTKEVFPEVCRGQLWLKSLYRRTIFMSTPKVTIWCKC